MHTWAIQAQPLVDGQRGRPRRAQVRHSGFTDSGDGSKMTSVDLITIRTRGHSGFSHWLVGGVAHRVIRGADVPVLLVHAMREEEKDHGERR